MPATIKNLLTGSVLYTSESNTLKGVDFKGQDLSNADFRGKDLSGCNFEGCNLESSNFMGATCHKVKMKDAVLTKSVLTYADFTGSDLNNVDARNTTCIETDFTKTDLSGATFLGAKFKDVDMNGAKIETAKFDKYHPDNMLNTSNSIFSKGLRKLGIKQKSAAGQKVSKDYTPGGREWKGVMDGIINQESQEHIEGQAEIKESSKTSISKLVESDLTPEQIVRVLRDQASSSNKNIRSQKDEGLFGDKDPDQKLVKGAFKEVLSSLKDTPISVATYGSKKVKLGTMLTGLGVKYKLTDEDGSYSVDIEFTPTVLPDKKLKIAAELKMEVYNREEIRKRTENKQSTSKVSIEDPSKIKEFIKEFILFCVKETQDAPSSMSRDKDISDGKKLVRFGLKVEGPKENKGWSDHTIMFSSLEEVKEKDLLIDDYIFSSLMDIRGPIYGGDGFTDAKYELIGYDKNDRSTSLAKFNFKIKHGKVIKYKDGSSWIDIKGSEVYPKLLFPKIKEILKQAGINESSRETTASTLVESSLTPEQIALRLVKEYK